MTANQFIEVLHENGYKAYVPDEFDNEQFAEDGFKTFGKKHEGDYYQAFGEVEVAFKVQEHFGSARVWLSIEYQDGKVETDISDIRVANTFLTLMDADTLKWRGYNGRLD